MAKLERVREAWSGPLDVDYFRRKAAEGWKLAATEWVREAPEAEAAGAHVFEEAPYGLRVAPDCSHLEEEPAEREALTAMMELIVEDYPLSRVAEELNRRGYRTRQAAPWSAKDVFNLIPRLVETGPGIFSSPEWAARRARVG